MPDRDALSSIDDHKSAKPRMRGFLHGSSIIWRERGIRGFFQGFVPTTARQAANSATRFGSYTTIKQFAQGYVAPGEKLGTMSTFGIGGLAGLITVYVASNVLQDWILTDQYSYATQPLDTIKTRSVFSEPTGNCSETDSSQNAIDRGEEGIQEQPCLCGTDIQG